MAKKKVSWSWAGRVERLVASNRFVIPSGAVVSDPLGLYVHIPFCESICNYCNFNRGLRNDELKKLYLDALVAEIRAAGNGSIVETVYFGGGTPSLLDPHEVARVLKACNEAFTLQRSGEVSLEANPESATLPRLEGWREAGVTRLSFGVQSFRDEELERLGRRHSSDQARKVIQAARAAGYDNISIDLMLWLPGQTRSQCLESVQALVELDPDHASLYILELYPNAPLKEEMARFNWSRATDDDVAFMYLEALKTTDEAGYGQYEISNVSRDGKECQHNLKYWRDGEWLGFGCGAHSTLGSVRWQNISDTETYIEALSGGGSPRGLRRILSDEEHVEEVLFTALRLTSGFDLKYVREKYGVDVMSKYGPKLEPFIDAGVLVREHESLRLTRQGMLVANEVMASFI